MTREAAGVRTLGSLAIVVALAVILGAVGPRIAYASSECAFTGGFASLRELLGEEMVGECLENEWHAPESGNTEQRTTRGLLVWRKAENIAAFTDGHHSWVMGPEGLMDRPNTERFAWEAESVLGTFDVPAEIDEPAAVEMPLGASVEISEVRTGWGPSPDAPRKFPYIEFTVTNTSPDVLPVYDTQLRYSADFFNPVTREPFGSGLGTPEQLGLAGLPPGYSGTVTITSTASVDETGGARVPSRLSVDLYQGNAFTGEREHVGTFDIPRGS